MISDLRPQIAARTQNQIGRRPLVSALNLSHLS
jgi:hypothetical protein